MARPVRCNDLFGVCHSGQRFTARTHRFARQSKDGGPSWWRMIGPSHIRRSGFVAVTIGIGVPNRHPTLRRLTSRMPTWARRPS